MSLFLNGTADSYILVKDDPDLQFGTGDFTIEWWQKYIPDPANKDANVCIFEMGSCYEGSIMAVTFEQGSFYYYANNMPYEIAVFDNDAEYQGSWTHFGIARSSGYTRFFYNGQQMGNTLYDPNNYSCGQNLKIGVSMFQDPCYPFQPFRGYIHNFQWIATDVFRNQTSFDRPCYELSQLVSGKPTESDYRVVVKSRSGDVLGILVSQYVFSNVVDSEETPDIDGYSLVFHGTLGSYLGIEEIDITGENVDGADFTISWWQTAVHINNNGCIFEMGNIRVFVKQNHMTYEISGQSFVYDIPVCPPEDPLLVEPNEDYCRCKCDHPCPCPCPRPVTSPWHHFAICSSSGVTQIFIDGIKQSATCDIIAQLRGSFTMGQQFQGYIWNYCWINGVAMYHADFDISQHIDLPPLSAWSTYQLILAGGTYLGNCGSLIRNYSVGTVKQIAYIITPGPCPPCPDNKCLTKHVEDEPEFMSGLAKPEVCRIDVVKDIAFRDHNFFKTPNVTKKIYTCTYPYVKLTYEPGVGI